MPDLEMMFTTFVYILWITYLITWPQDNTNKSRQMELSCEPKKRKWKVSISTLYECIQSYA